MSHLIPAPLPGTVFTTDTINKREDPAPQPAVKPESGIENASGKEKPTAAEPPSKDNSGTGKPQNKKTESGLLSPSNATLPDTVAAGSSAESKAPDAPQPQTAMNPASSGETGQGAVADETIAKGKNFMQYSQADYKLGYPEADKILAILESEMTLQLKNRQYSQQMYNTWISYLRARTASSARTSGVGGYNGVARLKWYEHLLLNPIQAPRETEEFSRYIHAGIIYGGTKGYNHMLKTIRPRMDVESGSPCQYVPVNSPEEAYKLLWTRLGEARSLHAKAIAGLTPAELKTMNANMYNILTVNANVGHIVNDRVTARNYILYLKKIDYSAYYDAASLMLSFSEKDFLDNLMKLSNDSIGEILAQAAQAAAAAESSSEEGAESKADDDNEGSSVDLGVVLGSDKTVTRAPVSIPGVQGEVLMEINCPAGTIIVGGRGPNVYNIEKIPNVCAIVDLGGSDVYIEGMVSMNRPLLAIIDEEGDDEYKGALPAIQGSAILGISFLLDRQGNDTYQAKHLAQGSCLGGVGILLDMDGNDTYNGVRRVQGSALAGLGTLIDLAGDDSYHAAMWAQGLGHPLGFGLLDDANGKDMYYCGGIYPDSYDDTPGYEGWGQGLGSGLRDIANGGIGVLLDGGGDDRYEYDYIAHGGGYWQGIGILRDFSGNDNHAGATVKEYNGGPRRQQRFQRLGNGFGCHYAVGYLFDDFGDDTYASTIMNTGFGWDASSGFLFDFQGKDKYTAVGGGSSGNGAQASMGVLFDYDGDDIYSGRGVGYASPSINPDYHLMPDCGGNFAFVVDYGGDDKYGTGTANNSSYQRGSAGGFLIDRPINPEKTIPAPRK